MRVIAGSARGTKLVAPRGMDTRPTADRVREALFSIIQSRYELDGTHVMDICAGTGGLGIEALSRGASSCCFIENNREALKCLKQNLHATHCTARATVLEMDLLKALPLLAARGRCFSIIFFDPPYASELYTTVLDMLSTLELLCPGGLFIAESAIRNVLPEKMGNFIKADRRMYGDTALEMYILGE
ncbi:MAG: 16S rRNA (guanine(966)-N(2))-methyltransferase RsmD [Desulfuromonadales bacterium]|nr:16S rRNA (guanine(966)-N(2))-methyltransferase RsmD [Desulfuromonadales bacterium]